MDPSMRPRQILAVLAAILAGLTLPTSAVAVAEHARPTTHAMPSGGCPPAC
jgi:hypothetical protein